MPKLAAGNLTLTRANRAKPQEAVYYIWDAEIRGFGLRVNVTGAKVFVMKYRNPEGKQAWLTLNEFFGFKEHLDKATKDAAQTKAEESLEKAKARAREYRQAIKDKVDPKTGIQRALEIPTFKKFSSDFLKIQKAQVSESYHKASTYFLEEIAGPQIGGIRMDKVEQWHVSDLIDGYTIGKRPWLKEGELDPPVKTNSNRFRGVLSVVFKAAEEKGIRPRGSNPCLYIKKLKEPKGKKRYLNNEEIAWLGKVLSDAPKWGDRKACPYAFNEKGEHLIIPTPYAVAALKLLLLTGCRKNEILRLRWDGIKKDRKLLVIEDHKTQGDIGEKELPLTPAVLSILEDLEKLPTRRLGGEWVIQGKKLDAPLVNIDDPWERVQEAVQLASEGAVNIDDVNLHVLRHSFASVGVSSGVQLFMVGELLSHTNTATTQRYSHLFTDPKLKAATQISDTIAGLMGS
jgi:integrase